VHELKYASTFAGKADSIRIIRFSLVLLPY